MRKLITGLAVILTLKMIINLCGCPAVDGRPPKFSIANPYAIPDGFGGTGILVRRNQKCLTLNYQPLTNSRKKR